MTDKAIYIRFTNNEIGTLFFAELKYDGERLCRLQFTRELSKAEQAELAEAVRLGAQSNNV